jgi:hypothetical protein
MNLRDKMNYCKPILGVFTIIVLSRESVKALFPTADEQKPTI